jgi:hypothetical protein
MTRSIHVIFSLVRVEYNFLTKSSNKQHTALIRPRAIGNLFPALKKYSGDEKSKDIRQM